MSTKAIRELIAAWREQFGLVRDDPGEELADDAEAELAAIEKAARDWWAQESRRGVVLASDALAPFERIALETAPKHKEKA